MIVIDGKTYEPADIRRFMDEKLVERILLENRDIRHDTASIMNEYCTAHALAYGVDFKRAVVELVRPVRGDD